MKKILGLDETGKGDIFGPLVIAGVVLSNKLDSSYRDSKRLRNNNLICIAQEIKEHHKHFIRIVNPTEYNQLFPLYNNQFLLMNHIYREVINKLKRGTDSIIVDKFSNYSIGIDNITYLTKAESKYQAVAAASIIAKAAQLEWFDQYPDLHRGATNDASKLLKNYDESQLFSIAKLHFKPVQLYTNR